MLQRETHLHRQRLWLVVSHLLDQVRLHRWQGSSILFKPTCRYHSVRLVSQGPYHELQLHSTCQPSPSEGLTEGVGLKRAADGEVETPLHDAQLYVLSCSADAHAFAIDVLDSASDPL